MRGGQGQAGSVHDVGASNDTRHAVGRARKCGDSRVRHDCAWVRDDEFRGLGEQAGDCAAGNDDSDGVIRILLIRSSVVCLILDVLPCAIALFDGLFETSVVRCMFVTSAMCDS
eukprot:3340832-Rhodomonas_salina.2